MLLAHELTGPEAAPPVVLIHGITESRATWQPVIDVLQRDHRVLAVDLRGHGESAAGDAYAPLDYAHDVADTVAAVGLVDPLVVGHSLGGVVATAYALVGPSCGIVDVDQPLRLAGFKAALADLEPMLKGSHDEFRAAIGMVFDQMRGPLAPAEVTRVEGLRRPVQEVVLGTWKAVFESSPDELDTTVRSLTSGVHVPYLSLHGIDPGPDYAAWLQAQIPQAVVEVWPDHGHYPFLVDLPRFVARLAEFEHEVRG
ncbi:MAG: alpha/beta hydrolase fold [Ilumatobacteraceae bacterium]|nr:alpha/beta hydrolase fold [Ilumatobacteraceae bacterium]